MTNAKPITKDDYADMLATLRSLEGRRVRVSYRAEGQAEPRPIEGVLSGVRAHPRLGHPIFRVGSSGALACLDGRLLAIDPILSEEDEATVAGIGRAIERHGFEPDEGAARRMLADGLNDDSLGSDAVGSRLGRDPAFAVRYGLRVCPRCLDVEPGKPAGSPDAPHPGPFRDELCTPCETANARSLVEEGRHEAAKVVLKKIARAITVSPRRLTREQSARVRSLVEDGGYSRSEARALVLGETVCP